MAVYAVGDVQGCYASLHALMAEMNFDPTRDRIWFTGDLVNRGPQSLEVLRFVKGLGAAAISVLGNHDLHLLAVASGAAATKPQDSLNPILHAPDRDALLQWLRTRPLLYHDTGLNYTLIHAGLLPAWDLAEAQALAREVEQALRGDAPEELYRHMYGDQPDHWDESLRGVERLRVIINAFTRLRYCDAEGRMDLRPKGPPGSQPQPLLPWFQVSHRRSRELRIVFGHWSTLGLWQRDGVIGLDTGCLWGGSLSAIRLDLTPLQIFSVPCMAQQTPPTHGA